MRYSVSGGGTGGHVYPALAVARALRDARPDVELDYVGGARGFERRARGQPRAARPAHATTSSSSARCGRPGSRITSSSTRLASAHRCRRHGWLLGKLAPAAVFTTGGYLALPLVLAARMRRIPTLVWEGNVQPGRATRAIGRYATRVAVSFPPTLDAFPGNSFVSGTPIRSFAGIDREAAQACIRPRSRRSAHAHLRRVAGGGQVELRHVRRAPAPARGLARPPRGRREGHGRCERCPPGTARGAAAALRRGALPDRSHGRCTRRRGPRPRACRARRPAPRSPLSAWPRSWCRTPTPARTSATTRGTSPSRAPQSPCPTRRSTPTGW